MSWLCFVTLVNVLSTSNLVVMVANAASGSKQSDWQEVIGSKVSIHFELSESIWHLLFHVGMFYSVFLSISLHMCIFCSVVVGISMYGLFMRCILYFIHGHKKWGWKVSLKITFFWTKKYFGSVYTNPIYFIPLWSPLLQTPNHPSITYQYGVLPMVLGP